MTKQEFELASINVASNLLDALPLMIDCKIYLQRAVIDIATEKELEDVRDCKINQGMIDKLCRLAKRKWISSGNPISIYCAAMAVATIVKEYDWGTQYLIGDGLWQMADRIQNS